MKLYEIRRVRATGRVECIVTEEGQAGYHLLHLVHHSPTGFEFGYPGSGPADLARSIIGDYLHDRNPHPALYQQFKADVIAKLDRDQSIHQITEDEVDEWFTSPFPAQIAQQLGDWT